MQRRTLACPTTPKFPLGEKHQWVMTLITLPPSIVVSEPGMERSEPRCARELKRGAHHGS